MRAIPVLVLTALLLVLCASLVRVADNSRPLDTAPAATPPRTAEQVAPTSVLPTSTAAATPVEGGRVPAPAIPTTAPAISTVVALSVKDARVSGPAMAIPPPAMPTTAPVWNAAPQICAFTQYDATAVRCLQTEVTMSVWDTNKTFIVVPKHYLGGILGFISISQQDGTYTWISIGVADGVLFSPQSQSSPDGTRASIPFSALTFFPRCGPLYMISATYITATGHILDGPGSLITGICS